MTAEQEIRRYGYEVLDNHAPDRLEVDFSISEIGGENVAWVWGNKRSYQVDCDHPVVEYGADDERGECLMCGATCDWHYELDACSVEDYHWEARERVPHEWYGEGKGLIDRYIEENQQ